MDKKRVDIDAVRQFKTEYKNMWWESPAEFPGFGSCYDASRQAVMEAEMQSFIDNIVAEVKKFPAAKMSPSHDWGTRLRSNVHSTGVKALGFTESNMRMLLDRGFCDSTYEFMDNAHRFDTSLKMDDIMQAMRNVWIMNCIQLMLDKEVEYTPPLFAYSMLYPYTDNFLDATGISPDRKALISGKLRLKLDGKPVKPLSAYEEKLFKLVETIEGYYSRETFKEVYESLLWIHDAQQKSLLLQKSTASPCTGDILDLSFQKGGTSVLADAFLVKGTLSTDEARFMFGFGTVLQLADDLQDAMTDRKNGHMTLFSQMAGKWPIDNAVNKLFNFADAVFEGGRNLKTPVMEELLEIMKRSCILLLLGAIANNSSLFTKDYLKRIGPYSPMSFKFIRKIFKRVQREYRNLRIRNAGRPVEVYMARALAKGI